MHLSVCHQMLEMPLFFKNQKNSMRLRMALSRHSHTALFFLGGGGGGGLGGAQVPVRLSEGLQALLGADALPRTGTPLSLRACGFICIEHLASYAPK